MAKEQSESRTHHWWPICLSKHWLNNENFLHRLFCNGNVKPLRNPKNFGAINHGHTIKFANKPSHWDENFEHIYQSADDAFPRIVRWLQSFKLHALNQFQPFTERLQPLSADWQDLNQLSECLVSLIVRSPQFRNKIKTTAEYYQDGWQPSSKNKNLVKFSLRDDLKVFSNNLKNCGKFAILHSLNQEFIFGDGFLHRFVSRDLNPNNPMMLIPVTPKLCVLYARPSAYKTNPALMGLSLNEKEVLTVNETIQIYSKQEIYYRSQKPDVMEEFKMGEFLEYKHHSHSTIDSWINDIAQCSKQLQ